MQTTQQFTLTPTQSQTNLPFINKYQPQIFDQFEQLEQNVIKLLLNNSYIYEQS
jgi:hypothetical protein